MTTPQDASIGIFVESTYKTPGTPTRWWEYYDESLDWDKNVKQGKGLRPLSRVDRSGRRTVPSAMGKGDFSLECISKGMGLFWQGCLGAGVSTNVSTGVFQQVFTLGDTPPSWTLQKGIPELGGTVDPYTFEGVMVDTWELDFPNADICAVKATLDIGDLITSQAYTAPSYASAPNLFHFAGGSVSTGTLTPPTATALGSAVTNVGDIRGGSLVVGNNLGGNRLNMGGAGRKSKPYIGGNRSIQLKLDAEYDATTFRDAVLNETPLCVLLNWIAGSLTAGFETLQVIIPELKADSELPKTNGQDLVIQSMSFTGLDNLTAAQPIWVVSRTSDTAL